MDYIYRGLVIDPHQHYPSQLQSNKDGHFTLYIRHRKGVFTFLDGMIQRRGIVV